MPSIFYDYAWFPAKETHTCIYLCNIVYEDVRVCIFKFAIFFCSVLEYFGDQNCHFFRFRETMYSCYAKQHNMQIPLTSEPLFLKVCILYMQQYVLSKICQMENCKHKKTTGLSLKNALQFVALKNNLDPAILGRGRKRNNKTEKFLSFKGCTEPAQNYQKFGTHTGIIGSNYFNRIKWLSSQEFYSLKPGIHFLDESKKFQSFWIISYTIAMELCYHTPFRLPHSTSPNYPFLQ